MSNAMLGTAVLGKMVLGSEPGLFNELITDRTQAHVNLLKRLLKKPWTSMTASEQEAWYGEATKGAYNYTDLNRVEAAVGILSDVLSLNLETKTDWTVWDRPTRNEMDRYLGNVAKIRNACLSIPDIPTLPSSMDNLNYKDANNIEMVLLLAYEAYKSISETWVRGGEIYCGEV